MRGEDVFDIGYAEIAEISKDGIRCTYRAAVDDGCFAVADEDCTVSVTNVNEMSNEIRTGTDWQQA